jgi:hypothetical protein
MLNEYLVADGRSVDFFCCAIVDGEPAICNPRANTITAGSHLIMLLPQYWPRHPEVWRREHARTNSHHIAKPSCTQRAWHLGARPATPSHETRYVWEIC